MLDLGLALIDWSSTVWPWGWLVLGVVLLLVELTVLGGSLMVLPFGVSAMVAALLGFGGVSITVQWAVFAAGGVLLFAAFWRYQSLVQQGNRLPPGVGAARLVGLTGVVTQPLDPSDLEAHGTVRVAGETWFARADADAVLPTGARVRVIEVEGTRLLVVPADPDATTDPRNA